MFTTRLARIDDARGIARVQLESWADRDIALPSPPDLIEVANQWEVAIRDQQSSGRLVVVEKDSDSMIIGSSRTVGSARIVGCAGIVTSPDPRLSELVLLEVAPSERRQMVASRLLNAIADIAQGFGADSIHAWVGVEEIAALTLLESAGWKLTGAQRQTMAAQSEAPRNELEVHTSLI